MPKLKYFHLGSSAQLESIACIAELTNLIVLELERIKKITDLSPIGDLLQLEGLAIEGDMKNTQFVDTLSTLSQLHKLKYLFLANLKLA